MTLSNYKTLIVGLGNRLRADDGLGLKVIDKLKQETVPQEILILQLGTAPINYLSEIQQAQYLIAVDALQGEKQPGSLYQLALEDIKPTTPQSNNVHSYSFLQVIKLARIRTGYPTKVFLYGLEPADLSFNDQLSQPIKDNLPQLVRAVKSKIKDLN